MANRRTLLVTAAAVLVPLTMVGAVATPASARVITPSGNVTCRVSGSLSFSPPLTPGNGTPNVSNEVISTSLALSGCAGSSNPLGQVPTASTSVVTKAIKIKAIKIGRTRYAGGCNTFASELTAKSITSTITWNNGIKGSKTTLGNIQLHEIAPQNSIGANGTATESFDGRTLLNAQLNSASSAALGTCLVGSGPSVASVTFDSSTSSITLRPITAYVVNEGADTVTPIDTATNTAGTPITGLTNPFDIAIAPNGATAYVTNYLGNTVTPINLATNIAGSPITVGTDALWDIAITPDGSTAYVTTPGADTVTPIDLATSTAGSPITVGNDPGGIAITPNGATAYVTNAEDSTVTPINTATNAAGTPISVGAGPTAIAISPDGATAYVDGQGDGSGNTVTPIHTATNTAGTTFAVNSTSGFTDIAITPNGTTAFVTQAISNEIGNTVTPIDLATNTVESAISVPDQPFGIAITPDGTTAYVSTAGDATVTPIDLATNTVETPINVGNGPFGIAIG